MKARIKRYAWDINIRLKDEDVIELREDSVRDTLKTASYAIGSLKCFPCYLHKYVALRLST